MYYGPGRACATVVTAGCYNFCVQSLYANFFVFARWRHRPKIRMQRLHAKVVTASCYNCCAHPSGSVVHSYLLFCTETLVYSYVEVIAGQSVELLCNTSLSSDIMWTYDADDGYVHYVYWNGRIDSDKPRLSLNTTAADFHSLVIDDTEMGDSGLYDCYDDEGLRQVGYQLIVNGK